MTVRIESAIARRDAPPRYTLCGRYADPFTIEPKNKPRLAAVFESARDAEKFKELYSAHMLEFPTVEHDRNAVVAALESTRPVLTDALVFDENAEVYLVEIANESDT